MARGDVMHCCSISSHIRPIMQPVTCTSCLMARWFLTSLPSTSSRYPISPSSLCEIKHDCITHLAVQQFYWVFERCGQGVSNHVTASGLLHQPTIHHSLVCQLHPCMLVNQSATCHVHLQCTCKDEVVHIAPQPRHN